MTGIELGLSRISRLLQHASWNWKAIHVAGTNGKGSITAYLSAILGEAGVRTGRFNSPHLIDRWDCIALQEKPVSFDLFSNVQAQIRAEDERLQANASEFEVLTATAFEIFNQANVQVGVVEVGLGGRLDATNILKPKDVLVSVISKIGLDHQGLLGNTLEDIAGEKAGIIKEGVPCVLDGTNEPSVIERVSRYADSMKAPLSVVQPESTGNTVNLLQPYLRGLNLAPHQISNLLVAIKALEVAQLSLDFKKPISESLSVVPTITWPGRLQQIDLRPIVNRDLSALLDGAHNPQAASALSEYVDKTLLPKTESITWILAMSKGKEIGDIVRELYRPGDKVIATKFTPVDGMPWVVPVDPTEIMSAVQSVNAEAHVMCADSFEAALQHLPAHHDSEVVIAGSLYLVSDVLRLLRSRQPVTSGGL